jgi:hypothetical protein
MEAYKFTTKISSNGIIQLPYNPELFDQEVEILIFPKEVAGEKNTSAVDFVNKWAGFLTETDPEEAKLNYLQEKHK